MRIIIKEATAFDIAADIASRTSFDRKLTDEEQKAKEAQEEQEREAQEEQEKKNKIEERSKKIIEFVKKEKQSGFIQGAIKKWNQLWHNHVSPNKIAQFGSIADFSQLATTKGYIYQSSENYISISKSLDLDEDEEQKFTIVYYFPNFVKGGDISSYVRDGYDFDLAEKFNSNFEPKQIIGIKNVAYQCYIEPNNLKVNEQVQNLLQPNKGTLLINSFKRAAVKKVVPPPKPEVAPPPKPATPTVTESVFDRWKLLASIK